ncbi:MAG: cytochrome c oxidase assembly factor Coa1 family protein [Marinifilaceae bacterium]
MKKFQLVNTIGAILWCVGFALERLDLYPYYNIGLYGAPPIIFIGLIMTFRYNIKERGLFSRLSTPTNTSEKIEDYFKHYREIWMTIIIFWIIIVHISTASIKTSKQFYTAVDYIKQDSTIEKKIGGFKTTGFSVEGTLAQMKGTSKFYFTVVGKKDQLKVKVLVDRIDKGIFEVTKIEYEETNNR